MNVIAIILLSTLGGVIRFTFDPFGTLGTLVVNLLGSFGLGLFYGILQKKHMPSWVQDGVAAGLIGSLTTFSAFVTDTETLITVAVWMAVGYAVLSVAGGMACCVLGKRIARVVLQVKSNEDEQYARQKRGTFAKSVRYEPTTKSGGD